jgi:hypothetical protein
MSAMISSYGEHLLQSTHQGSGDLEPLDAQCPGHSFSLFPSRLAYVVLPQVHLALSRGDERVVGQEVPPMGPTEIVPLSLVASGAQWHRRLVYL